MRPSNLGLTALLQKLRRLTGPAMAEQAAVRYTNVLRNWNDKDDTKRSYVRGFI